MLIMIGKKSLVPVCVLLMVSACASLQRHGAAAIDCSQVLGACAGAGKVCVSVGIPAGASSCDVDCQAQVLRKLYAAGVSTMFHTGALRYSQGCIGYREDLGGTKEGAQCIARVLGYELHSFDCNEDGWPYNVRVQYQFAGREDVYQH